MRSLKTFPGIAVVGVHDRDPVRLEAFCRHWAARPVATLDELMALARTDSALVLNLTNPSSHHAVSKACLEADLDVYSEKPLAVTMTQARELHALAAARGRMLASAPCSVLGESAQTLALAVRSQVVGKVRLVYAELDDDFITRAPFDRWSSESGAPWPHVDEFEVGCTLEHAGYYLTWLMACFGPVSKVVAASAETIPDKIGDGRRTAPDTSIATLFHRSGVVSRLTCSIVAPHDHRIRMFGDDGILEVDECWDNRAAVRVRRRRVIRRRLVNLPWARRLKLPRTTHPHVGRWGAASMNFALGPAEMLEARSQQRPCRLSADMALHLTEVTLAIQGAGSDAGSQVMTTTCEAPEPMPWARAF